MKKNKTIHLCKRIPSKLMAVLLAATLLNACGSSSNESSTVEEDAILVAGDHSLAAATGLSETFTLPIDDDENLSFVGMSNPENGVLSSNGNRLTYTPNSDFVGTDSFTYKVSDGENDSNVATIVVNVEEEKTITNGDINDIPVVDSVISQVEENTTIEITLGTNDNGAIGYSLLSGPAYGSLSIEGNIATYTPNENYSGPDSFTYKSNDAMAYTYKAMINVVAVNHPPIADAGGHISVIEGAVITLDGSDSHDPDAGDTLSYRWEPADNLNDATLQNPTYTPVAVINDTVQAFTLTVTDNGHLTAIDTVNVTTLNIPAQPQNLQAATTSNQQITLTWDTVIDATSYDICYATDPITEPNNCSVHRNGTLLVDVSSPTVINHLLANTEYFFVIIPKNANGEGMASIATRAFSVITLAPSPTGHLNDTGITECGDYAHDRSGSHNNSLYCEGTDPSGDPIPPGQDALSGRDVTHYDESDGRAGFNFTKLDASSAPLPSSAASWSCVRDNVTGLIWEVKSDTGLHGKSDRYNWYNDDLANNGGESGHENDDGDICHGYGEADQLSHCNTKAYVTRINKENYCGATDWRVPSLDELKSIVDHGVTSPNPTIDTDYFPNSQTTGYWSSTPDAYFESNAWVLFLNGGGDDADNKSQDFAVRLVRGGL